MITYSPFNEEMVNKRLEHFLKLRNFQNEFMVWNGCKTQPWISCLSETYFGWRMTQPEIHRTRLEQELIIDIDNKELWLNLKRAQEIQAWLLDCWEVPIALWYSGGKGIHMHTIIKNVERKEMLGLFFKINQMFRTKIDKGMMEQKRHMVRGEYSLHPKKKFCKTPIDEPFIVVGNLSNSSLKELDFIAEANRVEDKKDYARWYS